MLIRSHIYTAQTDLHYGNLSPKVDYSNNVHIHAHIFTYVFTHAQADLHYGNPASKVDATARPCIYVRIYIYIYIYTQADLYRGNPAFKCSTGRTRPNWKSS